MPENGLMTAAETHKEWIDAEAALRARPRPAEEIAGDLTAAEEIAAADARLAAARAATQAAQQALTAARGPGILTSHGSVFAGGTEETQALAAAVDAEQALLVERTRLHERINAQRFARKDPRQ